MAKEAEVLSFSEAPSSPLDDRNKLILKNKYLGYGKNSDGVLGYCGQLTVQWFDEASLAGRLESSNPLLFLSKERLSGTSTTVTYWMPPVAFPNPAGHITIQTPKQKKILSLSSLFPKSRTDYLSDSQVLLCLLSPAVLGLLYFTFVFLFTISGLESQVKELFGDSYQLALTNPSLVDFKSQGVGIYQLEVIPASESMQMIWAVLLFLCPLLTTKFFCYLTPNRKRRYGGVFASALLLPSFFLLTAWNFQSSIFPLHIHPDFALLDLERFLSWGFPINIAIATYLYLSAFGFWDRRIPIREIRIALPVVLTFLYALLAFVLIYARSWLTG